MEQALLARVAQNAAAAEITMITYPITDKKIGLHAYAFEIENAYVSPTTIVRILQTVNSIQSIRQRGLFAVPLEIHIEFRFCNLDYVVWEPYADSSRYWIGPRAIDDSSPDISPIELAFKEYQPSFFKKILGDILSLRFIKRLREP